MNFEKGLIYLSIDDLELASTCPFSINLSDTIIYRNKCVRCFGLKQIARYCLKRSFRNTNLPSIAILKNRYDDCLSQQGMQKEEREIVVRKDIGILADLVDFSEKYKKYIDIVAPSIELNFKKFIIKGEVDSILCIDKQYYATNFVCDDHDEINLLSYQTIAASLWIRMNYSRVKNNGVTLVKMSRVDPPKLRQLKTTPTTERLHSSINSILEYINPSVKIRNQKEYKGYLDGQLKQLPIRFGDHCWSCQYCLEET